LEIGYEGGMDVEQLKKDVRSGRITPDRLIDLIVTLQRELQGANQRIEQLERQLGVPPSSKISQPFSVEAEERRQEARGKKRRMLTPSQKRAVSPLFLSSV
jgi:transposase